MQFLRLHFFMMTIRAIVLAGIGVFGMAVASVRAETVTKTVQQGNVKAELSYERDRKPDEFPQVQNLRLKIQRSNQTVFDKAPGSEEYDRPLLDWNAEDQDSFLVRDLNGDQEPEVILDFFTGGAHCCTYSLIYHYDAKQQQYVESRAFWGNLGYQLQDLEGDGKVEFMSANDSFAYAFTSYAASAFPIQIWRFENGKMIDVTRTYPKLIHSHAYRLWQAYQEVKGNDADVRGILAAYLADKYLLGQQEDGWKRLRQVYQESDREEYFVNLRKFLKESGYGD
ncbi:hypothetical protein LBWT_49070 [Leptolyngbya boryana IAM M-101]|jgi:hypothetical protein|nr:hypothetical protein LBWT_49070 [Leptolyngbya boryana IAM M-101]BAS65287.1 hypothetical protein LBDG_49070 [Leptolyngbya boryana dg5]